MLSNLRSDKKIKKTVDTPEICGILFSVMTDMISCEEVFGVDADARSEFDAVCDEWLNESILAQDAEEDLVECEGCGEQWYAHQAGANGRIEWCRKCYKNDPYYV